MLIHKCVRQKYQGYSFEYVPTPLSSGGVGLFIDESLDYPFLEKISNEACHCGLR